MTNLLVIQPFLSLKTKFQQHFDRLIAANRPFFHCKGGADLWQVYLESFPEGEMRQSFNCNACKRFIRNFGDLVQIQPDFSVVSLWDFDPTGLDEAYVRAVKALRQAVEDAHVTSAFVTDTEQIGNHSDKGVLDDGTVVTWHHFAYTLPRDYVTRLPYGSTLATVRSQRGDKQWLFLRALDTISTGTTQTVLELIDSKILYKGEEFKPQVEFLHRALAEKQGLTRKETENMAWLAALKNPAFAAIRNSAIGTLLQNLEEGMVLDLALRKYEKVTAPSNYKRPVAAITPKMVAAAERTLEDLGLIKALDRKFATVPDITVNDVLFVNRNVAPKLAAANPFEQLRSTLPAPKATGRELNIGWEEFVNKIIPGAEKLEVLFENKHASNLVSLIAPQHLDSPTFFKNQNAFTWSYAGGFTDSLKQKVKAQGGTVENVLLRCSLEWFNTDDLDLHLVLPNGDKIYYAQKVKGCGNLDVDMNAGGIWSSEPVENIRFKNSLPVGRYQLRVHNFSSRNRNDKGFNIEVEWGLTGECFRFSSNTSPQSKRFIDVAKFEYDGNTFKIIEELTSTSASKEIWGCNSETWINVHALTYSPNYWEGEAAQGHRHLFFFMEGCKNDDGLVRGFSNEFIKDELLQQHKRVFEALASKKLVANQPAELQLSGLGFSTTKRGQVKTRVTTEQTILQYNIQF